MTLLLIFLIVIILALYLIGAFIVFKAEFGYLQTFLPELAKLDYEEDKRRAIIEGIIWPSLVFRRDEIEKWYEI